MCVHSGDQGGKAALQIAEASGHTATADAIRPAVLLPGQQQALRESASCGDVATVMEVLGVDGLNVDAVDEVYTCVVCVCVCVCRCALRRSNTHILPPSAER